ncbi:MAG: hypothetical protein ACHQ9S_25630 [Candidatus Binatia bacterium]
MSWMDFLRSIGSYAGLLSGVLVAVYAWPGSPLRRVVDSWIERRVQARFDFERDQYRHQLSLEAEQVKAKYQGDLHNLGLIVERRHEICRELYRLLSVSDGAAGSLFGARLAPVFDAYSPEQVLDYMKSRHFPGTVVEQVQADWTPNRRAALELLTRTDRNAEIEAATRAYHEANNYMLTNALYLPESAITACRDLSAVLWDIIGIARFPAPRSDSIGKKKLASERLLVVKAQLQALVGTQP